VLSRRILERVFDGAGCKVCKAIEQIASTAKKHMVGKNKKKKAAGKARSSPRCNITRSFAQEVLQTVYGNLFSLGVPADLRHNGSTERANLEKKPSMRLSPGAMVGREGECEAMCGLLCDPGPGLLGDVCGMIV
jgi:hypothetical protein